MVCLLSVLKPKEGLLVIFSESMDNSYLLICMVVYLLHVLCKSIIDFTFLFSKHNLMTHFYLKSNQTTKLQSQKCPAVSFYYYYYQEKKFVATQTIVS